MNKVIAFVLGAAAGSLVTWKLIEKKYKDIADEEIASVVDRFKNKETVDVEPKRIVVHQVGTWPKESKEDQKIEEDKKDYAEKIQDLGYSNEDDGSVYMAPGEDVIAPFIISPEEYGEKDHYDTQSWSYYADGVLTDESGEIVMDAENIIGDALDHFGDYDDDSVYVRNENEECDYEILRYEKSFSESNEENY